MTGHSGASSTTWLASQSRALFSAMADCARRWLRREVPPPAQLLDRCTLVFLLVTCFWYLVTYFAQGMTPGLHPGDSMGWWLWYDQGNYYKSVINLAHGELRPSIYWPGYPLLGAPFYEAMPMHPFLVPNLVLTLIMTGSFFAACRHFIGRLEAWVLAGFFIFFAPVLRDQCLIIPWNTLPAYAAIYLSIYLLLVAPVRASSFILCAILDAVALSSRPNEVFPLGTIYLFGVLNLQGNARWWALALFSGMTAVVGGLLIALNFYLYGHASSPYMLGESAKFSAWAPGLKAYQFLCDGAFLTGDAVVPTAGTRPTQILERFPYFLCVLPGAIYLVKTRGWAVGGIFAAIALTVGIYLTYMPFDSSAYFWSYGSYHYIWWIIPWLGLIAYLSFRQAPFVLSRNIYIISLLAPILLYLLVGFKAREVAATDMRQSPLIVTPTDQASTSGFDLTPGSYAGTVLDVRLQFSKPPAYNGTEASSVAKVTVTLNGALQANACDYAMSQAGNAYDFLFLARPLHLHPGDHLRFTFAETPRPQLERASLRVAYFSPGRAVARLLTP
jgi:hypothetical protein